MNRNKRLTSILFGIIFVLEILNFYGFLYYRLPDFIGI